MSFPLNTYSDFCLDGAGKALRPFHARELVGDLLDDILMHQVRLEAHVV